MTNKTTKKFSPEVAVRHPFKGSDPGTSSSPRPGLPLSQFSSPQKSPRQKRGPEGIHEEQSPQRRGQ
jgi:hypothetical protein